MSRARDIAPLSIGEILARIDRRLAWYGLPQTELRAVEVTHGAGVVATVRVAGRATYCEVLDRWTGAVLLRRPAIQPVTP